MNFPEQLKYSKDHEWIVVVEGNVAKIGISDFAQGELGDIVYVDIPSVGKSLAAHAEFGSIEAVKTVSELYLPVSGKVLEINSLVSDSPALVNSDPYGEGWIIKLEITSPDDLNTLMSAEEYRALIGV